MRLIYVGVPLDSKLPKNRPYFKIFFSISDILQTTNHEYKYCYICRRYYSLLFSKNISLVLKMENTHKPNKVRLSTSFYPTYITNTSTS